MDKAKNIPIDVLSMYSLVSPGHTFSNLTVSLYNYYILQVVTVFLDDYLLWLHDMSGAHK